MACKKTRERRNQAELPADILPLSKNFILHCWNLAGIDGCLPCYLLDALKIFQQKTLGIDGYLPRSQRDGKLGNKRLPSLSRKFDTA